MRQFLELVPDASHRTLEFRCALLIYLAVLVFGSIPGARADVGKYASGLVLHAGTYALITLLLFRGTKGGPWRKALTSFLIVAAMGAMDEGVQSFLPYRTADLFDWLIDVQAALFTSALLSIILISNHFQTRGKHKHARDKEL